MRKLVLLIMLSGSSAMAAGGGGMAECYALAVQAALARHAALYPGVIEGMPEVTVRQSDGSPSNGIDIMVTVGGAKTYYVIATPQFPDGEPPGAARMTGCTRADVDYESTVAPRCLAFKSSVD